jgi:hypothetical protein
MIEYHYEVCGTASDGQTWTTTGSVFAEKAGQFMNMPMLAMKQTFLKLTQGKAVFGKPGVGCRGPYKVTKLTIQEPKEPTNESRRR